MQKKVVLCLHVAKSSLVFHMLRFDIAIFWLGFVLFCFEIERIGFGEPLCEATFAIHMVMYVGEIGSCFALVLGLVLVLGFVLGLVLVLGFVRGLVLGLVLVFGALAYFRGCLREEPGGDLREKLQLQLPLPIFLQIINIVMPWTETSCDMQPSRFRMPLMHVLVVFCWRVFYWVCFDSCLFRPLSFVSPTP